jgi:hypothetical protein
MKTFHWMLNVFSLLLTGVALLSLVCHPINDVAVNYAGENAMFGPIFAYLIFSTASTFVSLIAIAVGGSEASRFPYYCIVLTWAPLFFLAIFGGILMAAGKLYWISS